MPCGPGRSLASAAVDFRRAVEDYPLGSLQ